MDIRSVLMPCRHAAAASIRCFICRCLHYATPFFLFDAAMPSFLHAVAATPLFTLDIAAPFTPRMAMPRHYASLLSLMPYVFDATLLAMPCRFETLRHHNIRHAMLLTYVCIRHLMPWPLMFYARDIHAYITLAAACLPMPLLFDVRCRHCRDADVFTMLRQRRCRC